MKDILQFRLKFYDLGSQFEKRFVRFRLQFYEALF